MEYNSVKYYDAKPKLGNEKYTSIHKPFDIEFRPFIEEINAKEGVIRACADATTLERIRGMVLHIVLVTYNSTESKIRVYRH